MYENSPYDCIVCNRAKTDCRYFNGGYCANRDCAYAIKIRCIDDDATRVAGAALVYAANALMAQEQIKKNQQKILQQQEQILTLLQQQKIKQ